MSTELLVNQMHDSHSLLCTPIDEAEVWWKRFVHFSLFCVWWLIQVGTVHSTTGSEDDHKTLEELSFQTGDFLDVAVMLWSNKTKEWWIKMLKTLFVNICYYWTPAQRAKSMKFSPPITLLTNRIPIVVKYAIWGTLFAIDMSTNRSKPTTIWYRVFDETPMNNAHTKAVLNKGGTSTESTNPPSLRCRLKSTRS